MRPRFEHSIQDAAERIWKVGYLYREGAVDRAAADSFLWCLQQHSHAGVKRLCERVTQVMDRPAAPMPEPIVEVFAR
jgi:hypothetical protein